MKFQEALDANTGDPITITFEIGFKETRAVQVQRETAEQYAKWAKEEMAPELELLFHMKPTMHNWIKSHRLQMCDRLKSALEKYNSENSQEIQIVWPIATPDVVPVEIVKEYIRRYA